MRPLDSNMDCIRARWPQGLGDLMTYVAVVWQGAFI